MITKLFQVEFELPETVSTNTKAFDAAFYKATDPATESSIESYGIKATIYAVFESYDAAVRCENILTEYVNSL